MVDAREIAIVLRQRASARQPVVEGQSLLRDPPCPRPKVSQLVAALNVASYMAMHSSFGLLSRQLYIYHVYSCSICHVSISFGVYLALPDVVHLLSLTCISCNLHFLPQYSLSFFKYVFIQDHSPIYFSINHALHWTK